jgi:hypothetical protein
MRGLTNELLELIRRTSSSLPAESSHKVLEDLLARPY